MKNRTNRINPLPFDFGEYHIVIARYEETGFYHPFVIIDGEPKRYITLPYGFGFQGLAYQWARGIVYGLQSGEEIPTQKTSIDIGNMGMI